MRAGRSVQDRRDGAVESRCHRFLRIVPAVTDRPFAADHDVPDGFGRCGEDEGIEHGASGPAVHHRMGFVQDDQVGTMGFGDPADRAAQRLASPVERRQQQLRPGMIAGRDRARQS